MFWTLRAHSLQATGVLVYQGSNAFAGDEGAAEAETSFHQAVHGGPVLPPFLLDHKLEC